MDINTDYNLTIRNLADQTTVSKGLVAFTLQSLISNKYFDVEDALVVPELIENEGVLPHSIHVKHTKHFKGVEIPTLSGGKSIGILIGQKLPNDKLLLAVSEEREGSNSKKPNYVLTRLGLIASVGCVHTGSKSLSNLKVQTNKNCKHCELFKRENIALKEATHTNEIENETLQPTNNDEIARKLVES